MLSREDNDLITQTGPGTPGGEMMRHYWQPVALVEEVPQGGAPIPVRVMGEDLTLFRDQEGRLGLLGIHCSHRAADLSYGRIEAGGLRCLYHGWLYDVTGQCIEQPGEPAGSTFKDKVKQLAYPCQELGGLVFAYLGHDEPPLLPNLPFLTVPTEQRVVHKLWQDCNYLQGNEGNIDPQHLSYLHRYLWEEASFSGEASTENVAGGKSSGNSLFGGDVTPDIDLESTNYGFRLYTVRDADESSQYVRITNFIHPNASSFPAAPGVYGAHIHVPVDDTHHWKFQFMVNRSGPMDKEKMGPLLFADLDPDRHMTRNAHNRYLQDREEMRTRSFIGRVPSFNVHDGWATEGEGPIQDRTTEQLGYTDKGVIQARKLLLKAVHDVLEGAEPACRVHHEQDNDFEHLRAVDEVVDKTRDSREVLHSFST